MTRTTTTLTELARYGFADLGEASGRLPAFPVGIAKLFAAAANPDQALRYLSDLNDAHPDVVGEILTDGLIAARLIRLLGASEGIADFLMRHPDQLTAVRESIDEPLTSARYGELLTTSVSSRLGEEGWNALRVAYRRELLRLAAWDLEQPDGLDVVDRVGAALADLAAAALDASLLMARASSRGTASETKLAIIGMGKAGARELNYLSDVDVIFVTDSDTSVEAATRLAMETMRGVGELALEPLLWEVDANLRPEGKDGALVRSLDSHVAYYERWAKSWEFQALLKARPLAGDRDLGEQYVERIWPLVWSSASREGFVDSVQQMRERVTAHIPSDEVDIQLKLGPGGLRDIEFTIQLLQLVHGQVDENVRHRSTLDALAALADQGYIGRAEAAEFGRDYRFLRLLEHRLQLARLRRTHLMPRDKDALRVLARASAVASSGSDLSDEWQRVKIRVRSLHERLFYRPLLSAVAALPEEGFALTSEQAEARLAAIGFVDPRGALHHIAALSGGSSRRSQVQKTLLPVMLQWFSEGADPDYGLLAFRRLSDDLGEEFWFLRMLRDSSGAARRLTHVLASSRYVGSLFERFPGAAAWLESDGELRPRSLEELLDETAATLARHRKDPEAAAKALRTARRREVLRLALAGILGLISVDDLGIGLSAITTAILTGALALARRDDDGIEFGIIAMGRYGGAELGFGSDADIIYVYRAIRAEAEDAQRNAERIVHELVRLTDDLRLPLDLDAGLRPEGKNGAIVRSLDSYRAYYERWSLTWEAQALLRARGVAGDEKLLEAFDDLADGIRFPEKISATDLREIKRIKARVESERLPRGADPARHLKLGRGSLSDVEWLVQLLQLQHGAREPGLRTSSTLKSMDAAVQADLLDAGDAARLRAAWLIASRARSALTLWSAKTSDVLPGDRRQLEGVARLMEYPAGGASQLEEDYLRTTRLARQVFERLFYDSSGS